MTLGGAADLALFHQVVLQPTLPTSIQYVCHWDGSFSESSAGIGITIAIDGTLTLSLGVPVKASDATRTESLGPALIGLVLNVFPKGDVHMYGDSKVVVGQLNKESPCNDVMLFNCAELCRDVLEGWNLRVTWIPRLENTVCD